MPAAAADGYPGVEGEVGRRGEVPPGGALGRAAGGLGGRVVSRYYYSHIHVTSLLLQSCYFLPLYLVLKDSPGIILMLSQVDTPG